MTRLAEIDPGALAPELRALYEHASPRARMLLTPTAHAPGIMQAVHDFHARLIERATLPPHLIELLRLRIAFHNQCRSCMAMRYRSALDDGLTEDLVCSLERPQESADLVDAEKAALAFADLSATDHLAIGDDSFAALRRHFTEAEIVELGALVAYFIGFGRMVAAWDLSEELPGAVPPAGAAAAPWRMETFVVNR